MENFSSPLIPISGSYDHPHNHIISSSPTPRHLLQLNNGTVGLEDEVDDDYATNKNKHMANDHHKIRYRYRECLKNHAASMGGNATDGCGEFMPAGEEGSLEALKCSACNCHRNFHRKEIEDDDDDDDDDGGGGVHRYYHLLTNSSQSSCKKLVILQGPHPHLQATPKAALVVPNQMIMPYATADDQQAAIIQGHQHHHVVKKRFRTKFTPEQKEKMLSFAEKVGWRIQKQEETVVHRFCQEIGVKRRVLKVWMHNNKHNYNRPTLNNTTSTATTSDDHHHHQPMHPVNQLIKTD